MDLERLENQLKLRLNEPYIWGKKQNNETDKITNFIYKTRSFEALKNQCIDFDEMTKNYAYNRWLNFWSAQGVEQIFAENASVKASENQYDKSIDFYLNGIPFDHKTTVFPRKYPYSLSFAQVDKESLIRWLYAFQSQEKRFHNKNRLFIVLFDSPNGEHWKLKAEIAFLKQEIKKYIQNFDSNNLVKIQHKNQIIYSDIIWILK